MAERAGRCLHTGNFARFRMATKNGVAVAEGIERLKRDEAFVGEHDIEREAAMSFAQDHAVAVAPVRLLWPVAQDVVIQHAHDLNKRHRRADMAAPAAFKAAHYQTA